MRKSAIENRLVDAEKHIDLGEQTGLTSTQREELERLNEQHDDISKDELQRMIVHYGDRNAALALDLAMRSIGGAL